MNETIPTSQEESTPALSIEEYFNKEILSSRKDPSKRAGWTRIFLSRKKIDSSNFISQINKLGIPFGEEDFEDDSKLVKTVIALQENFGFEQANTKTGQDGILGPLTLEAMNLKVSHLEKREETMEGSKTALAHSAAIIEQDLASPQGEVDPQIHGEEKMDNPPKVAESIPASPNADSIPAAAPAEHSTDYAKTDVEKHAEDLLASYPGKHFVTRLSGNGGRPVAVYVPKGFDPSKPAEFAYHFHGTNGQAILEGAVGADRFGRALSATKRQGGHRNMILIYPLSAGRRGRPGTTAYKQGYDFDWMKPGNNSGDDMNTLHQQVMASLSQNLGYAVSDPYITLSGHSAGGVALANVMQSGFGANRVKFLDASYGHWAKSAYAFAKQNGLSTEFEIYYRPKTNTDNQSTRELASYHDTRMIQDRRSHGAFVNGFV